MRYAIKSIGLALSFFVCGCAGSVTVPNIVNVGGTWTGNETDRLGPAVLTWTLTQTGHDVTGSAAMRPVNATDGSCASCHKSKDGTIRGNVSGTTLTLVMFFPSGGKDDLTPKCSILLRSSATDISKVSIVASYSGSDPCEGTFDGSLAMTRRP